jgi:hypothetical protein
MISMAEARLARHAKRGRRGDMAAVSRILETLPALSACNDLRALTDLEGANRTLFQEMQVRSALIALNGTRLHLIAHSPLTPGCLRLQGVQRMVDYLRPRGQNAPYATIVARTLPCVLDARGRSLFIEYSMGTNAEGEVRLRSLSALLLRAHISKCSCL